MKLRNLLIASLAICSMASCTKDDDGLSTPQEVDAYFSIAATTDQMTKSSGDGGEDSGKGLEATVNSLTAYVFTTDGKYVISKHVSLGKGGNGDAATGINDEDYSMNEGGTSITAIKGIHVKVAKPAEEKGSSASQFKVVLLANTNHRSVTDLAGLKKEVIADITTYNQSGTGEAYLPMHSAELSVGGLKISYEQENTTHHILNWYAGTNNSVQTETTNGTHEGEAAAGAAKVSMVRSVARVQFVSLTTDFSALQYKNLALTVKSIFLANVRVNATVMGEENKDAAFYRGAPSEFKTLQFLIDNESSVKPIFNKSYTKGLVIPKYVGDNDSDNNSEALSFDTYITANSPKSTKGIPYTVNGDGTYSKKEGEEGAYQTRLVIEGELADNGNFLGTRYFHIPLKLIEDGNVESNKFFKVSAVITGEGSPNPDEILENTCVNFSIKIDPWDVIEQKENDTN